MSVSRVNEYRYYNRFSFPSGIQIRGDRLPLNVIKLIGRALKYLSIMKRNRIPTFGQAKMHKMSFKFILATNLVEYFLKGFQYRIAVKSEAYKVTSYCVSIMETSYKRNSLCGSYMRGN